MVPRNGSLEGPEMMPEGKIILRSSRLQIRINIMFLVLALLLEGSLLVYWMWVLEPQIMKKIRLTADRLSLSQAHYLVDALAGGGKEIRDARLGKALDKMLVLKDPGTGSLFTVGVEVKLDCEVLNYCDGEFHVKRGDNRCDECFITEVPLYDNAGDKPLGVARLHNSNAFFSHYRSGVKTMFATGAGVGLGFLLLSWAAMNRMMVKIRGAEQEVREKQAQIIQAGRLSAMGEMSTGIAHEINQPLSIIRVAAEGLADYIKENAPGTMEAEAAGSILAQVERTAGIIDNMRSFVRVGADDHALVDLSDSVNTALSFFREQFRINSVDLTVTIGENIPGVGVNPRKFEQIVVNLLSNARHAVDGKAASAPGAYEKKIGVRLFYGEAGNRVVFEVEDNGIGMTPAVQGRCLEPFFTTKEVGEGTGIGLAVVNGFVREYGMRLSIESTPGEGTIVGIGITPIRPEAV